MHLDPFKQNYRLKQNTHTTQIYTHTHKHTHKHTHNTTRPTIHAAEVCPVVLHKLDPALLLLPKLEVAVHAAGDYEVAAGHLQVGAFALLA